MNKKGFTKNFVIIGVILGAVFLSQQMNVLGNGNSQTFVNSATEQAQGFAAMGTKWLTDRLLPGISGEVQKRGEMVTQGVVDQVNEQKEKVTETISEKIKNYFSGVAESIAHPGTPQNCPPQTPSD